MSWIDLSEADEKVLDSLGSIPDGEYKVVVANLSKETSRKNPNIAFAKTELEIVEGDFMGRKVFQNYIMRHPTSSRAVEIGRARFKLLLLCATDSPILDDPQDLYGRPVYIGFKNRKGKDGQNSLEIDSISKEPSSNSTPPPGLNRSAQQIQEAF
jgi:hypothetical protein